MPDIQTQTEYIVTWGPWIDHDDLPCNLNQDYVEELIIADLVKSERIICGFDHQNLEDGCPYINGDPMAYSFRGWGRVMAKARNIVENTHNYDYCSFAWTE